MGISRNDFKYEWEYDFEKIYQNKREESYLTLINKTENLLFRLNVLFDLDNQGNAILNSIEEKDNMIKYISEDYKLVNIYKDLKFYVDDKKQDFENIGSAWQIRRIKS